MASTTEQTTTEPKFTGMVKWFNKTTGFGFISVLDGEYQSKDIFTHYSAINVSGSLYKYLVQGEYVELSIVKTPNDKHELQSANVGGIMGGPLMCETRALINSSSNKKSARATKQTD
jgi:cold shock CspA family protein